MSTLEQLTGTEKFLAGDSLSLADLHGWWEHMKARDSMAKTEPQLG